MLPHCCVAVRMHLCTPAVRARRRSSPGSRPRARGVVRSAARRLQRGCAAKQTDQHCQWQACQVRAHRHVVERVIKGRRDDAHGVRRDARDWNDDLHVRGAVLKQVRYCDRVLRICVCTQCVHTQ